MQKYMFALLTALSAITAHASDTLAPCPHGLANQADVLVDDEDVRRLADLVEAEMHAFRADPMADEISYWIGRARRTVDLSRLKAILDIYVDRLGTLDTATLDAEVFHEAVKTYLMESRRRAEKR